MFYIFSLVTILLKLCKSNQWFVLQKSDPLPNKHGSTSYKNKIIVNDNEINDFLNILSSLISKPDDHFEINTFLAELDITKVPPKLSNINGLDLDTALHVIFNNPLAQIQVMWKKNDILCKLLCYKINQSIGFYKQIFPKSKVEPDDTGYFKTLDYYNEGFDSIKTLDTKSWNEATIISEKNDVITCDYKGKAIEIQRIDKLPEIKKHGESRVIFTSDSNLVDGMVIGEQLGTGGGEGNAVPPWAT